MLSHCAWGVLAVGVGILLTDGFYRAGSFLYITTKNIPITSVSTLTSSIPDQKQNATLFIIDTSNYSDKYSNDWQKELERIDKEYKEQLLRELKQAKQVAETNIENLKYFKEAFTMQPFLGQPDWFPKNLHITIDDGPMIANQSLQNILNVLWRFDVKATFFIVGIHLERNYAILPQETTLLLNRILEEGHQIGYHSYEHIHIGSRVRPRLDKQEKEAIIADIKKSQDLISQVLERPFSFSVGRMPGGNGTFNEHVIEAFKESGLENPKSWSINTEFWENAVRGNKIESYVKGLLARKSDYIILLHEYPRIAKELDQFLTVLKNISEPDSASG